MARKSNTVADAEPEEIPAEAVTETITYIPGDGDPVSVLWGGHTFKANVPKEITGHPDGTEREKLNMHMIERARDNKTFTVGNAKPKREQKRAPETAEQYRGYMIDWLQDPAIQHAEDLIARFAKDRTLRAACEVGSDDYSYLSTLFMPRLHKLATADELTEGQVSHLWMQHGFNELPW